MGFLDSIFNRNKEVAHMFDMELLTDISKNAYIKRFAIETCVNYIAKGISQTEFIEFKKGKRLKDNWYYKLNVKPNHNQNATDFWKKAMYKLLTDNQLLIVLVNNQLLIADDFDREDLVMSESIFKDIVVSNGLDDDYKLSDTFKMGDVFYLEYNNSKLDEFMAGLFADYGDLFGTMYQINKRNNQIRAKVKLNSTAVMDEAKMTQLKTYIQKTYDSIANSSVAIVPELNGMTYEEVSSVNSSSGNSNYSDMQKLIRDILSYVANIYGIPVTLITGEVADSKDAKQRYFDDCVGPLLGLIQSELNAKFIKENDFKKGSYFKLVGINKFDIFSQSNNVDKLIASGALLINEIRELDNREPIEGGDVMVMTKNYETALKGGDSNVKEE